jgi:adenylate cyclase
MTPTRRLAAILAADVAGYSAMMERDEEGTATAVGALQREVIEPKLDEHRGRLIKTTGDGFLAEFASPIAALNCALAIQQRPNESNGPRLRIGLNLGDVIIEESGDVLGEGVNIAARLEGLAEPGGILISNKIYSEVEGKVQATFEDRGEQQIKNLSKPVRAYAVRTGASSASKAASLLDTKPLPLPDKPSIAVLPFQNMSGDPEQEYFADGMVEEIITALSRFKSLFVIVRNSSFTYKGKAVDIKQVGRELGVRYVLEGSVRKAGSRLRITGQLIDAGTGTHLWADRFEGTLEDVFELQDTLTEQVVASIGPELSRAELERARVKRPENLDAHDHVLKAQALMRPTTVVRIRAALAELYAAMDRSPHYAFAMGLAAECYGTLDAIAEVTASEAQEAMRLAKTAAEFGRDDPEALIGAAYAHTGFDTLEAATAMIDLALKINPNLARAWSLDGFAWMYLGDHVRSLSSMHRAMRLNPADLRVPMLMGGIATIHFLRGELDHAFDWAQRASDRNPPICNAFGQWQSAPSSWTKEYVQRRRYQH